MKGKLAVISGPSAGAGKDTLLAMFLERHSDNWHQPVSTTTRKLRPGEKQGKEMRTVSEAEFKQWEDEGKFLETDFHAGNWYGTLKEPVEKYLNQGKNVILRIDVNGAMKLREKMPDATLIFIKAENFETLATRIRQRASESEEQIKSRLELAKHELTFEPKYDHVVINETGKLDQSLKQLEDILL